MASGRCLESSIGPRCVIVGLVSSATILVVEVVAAVEKLEGRSQSEQPNKQDQFIGVFH